MLQAEGGKSANTRHSEERVAQRLLMPGCTDPDGQVKAQVFYKQDQITV
jgi:hypothetical protein